MADRRPVSAYVLGLKHAYQQRLVFIRPNPDGHGVDVMWIAPSTWLKYPEAFDRRDMVRAAFVIGAAHALEAHASSVQ